MTQTAHDYSRHSDDELHDAIRTVNAQKHPERALGLMLELERRLGTAKRAAAIVATDVAIRVGARFGEVDRRTRRPLFWWLFLWSVVVSIVYAFVQGVAMSVIDEALKEYYSGSDRGRFWIDSTLSLLTMVLLAVAHWRALLEIITRGTYRGVGLRVAKTERPADAA